MVHEGKVYVGMGQDPEHGEGVGNFWVIDPAGKTGDITDKAKVWHRGGKDFHRTISTVAIQDGIVYAADLSGFLYALDAKTGQHFWTHDMLAAVWGSPFVADGKLYLGDEDGDVTVLKLGQEEGSAGGDELRPGGLRDAVREGRDALRAVAQPALGVRGGRDRRGRAEVI